MPSRAPHRLSSSRTSRSSPHSSHSPKTRHLQQQQRQRQISRLIQLRRVATSIYNISRHASTQLHRITPKRILNTQQKSFATQPPSLESMLHDLSPQERSELALKLSPDSYALILQTLIQHQQYPTESGLQPKHPLATNFFSQPVAKLTSSHTLPNYSPPVPRNADDAEDLFPRVDVSQNQVMSHFVSPTQSPFLLHRNHPTATEARLSLINTLPNSGEWTLDYATQAKNRKQMVASRLEKQESDQISTAQREYNEQLPFDYIKHNVLPTRYHPNPFFSTGLAIKKFVAILQSVWATHCTLTTGINKQWATLVPQDEFNDLHKFFGSLGYHHERNVLNLTKLTMLEKLVTTGKLQLTNVSKYFPSDHRQVISAANQHNLDAAREIESKSDPSQYPDINKLADDNQSIITHHGELLSADLSHLPANDNQDLFHCMRNNSIRDYGQHLLSADVFSQVKQSFPELFKETKHDDKEAQDSTPKEQNSEDKNAEEEEEEEVISPRGDFAFQVGCQHTVHHLINGTWILYQAPVAGSDIQLQEQMIKSLEFETCPERVQSSPEHIQTMYETLKTTNPKNDTILSWDLTPIRSADHVSLIVENALHTFKQMSPEHRKMILSQLPPDESPIELMFPEANELQTKMQLWIDSPYVRLHVSKNPEISTDDLDTASNTLEDDDNDDNSSISTTASASGLALGRRSSARHRQRLKLQSLLKEPISNSPTGTPISQVQDHQYTQLAGEVTDVAENILRWHQPDMFVDFPMTHRDIWTAFNKELTIPFDVTKATSPSSSQHQKESNDADTVVVGHANDAENTSANRVAKLKRHVEASPTSSPPNDSDSDTASLPSHLRRATDTLLEEDTTPSDDSKIVSDQRGYLLRGSADFIVRVGHVYSPQPNGQLVKEHLYELWDTKLRRDLTAKDVMQTIAYGSILNHRLEEDMLRQQEEQGNSQRIINSARITHISIVHGTGKVSRLPLNAAYSQLIARLSSITQFFLKTFHPLNPPMLPSAAAGVGYFETFAKDVWKYGNLLPLVTELRESRILSLISGGFTSISDVATGVLHQTRTSSPQLRQSTVYLPTITGQSESFAFHQKAIYDTVGVSGNKAITNARQHVQDPELMTAAAAVHQPYYIPLEQFDDQLSPQIAAVQEFERELLVGTTSKTRAFQIGEQLDDSQDSTRYKLDISGYAATSLNDLITLVHKSKYQLCNLLFETGLLDIHSPNEIASTSSTTSSTSSSSQLSSAHQKLCHFSINENSPIIAKLNDPAHIESLASRDGVISNRTTFNAMLNAILPNSQYNFHVSRLPAEPLNQLSLKHKTQIVLLHLKQQMQDIHNILSHLSHSDPALLARIQHKFPLFSEQPKANASPSILLHPLQALMMINPDSHAFTFTRSQGLAQIPRPCPQNGDVYLDLEGAGNVADVDNLVSTVLTNKQIKNMSSTARQSYLKVFRQFYALRHALKLDYLYGMCYKQTLGQWVQQIHTSQSQSHPSARPTVHFRRVEPGIFALSIQEPVLEQRYDENTTSAIAPGQIRPPIRSQSVYVYVDESSLSPRQKEAGAIPKPLRVLDVKVSNFQVHRDGDFAIQFKYPNYNKRLRQLQQQQQQKQQQESAQQESAAAPSSKASKKRKSASASPNAADRIHKHVAQGTPSPIDTDANLSPTAEDILSSFITLVQRQRHNTQNSLNDDSSQHSTSNELSPDEAQNIFEQIKDSEITVFHDWWCHTPQQELFAYNQIVDFLAHRKRQYPMMHVYHYAIYEMNAMKSNLHRLSSDRWPLVEHLIGASLDPTLRSPHFMPPPDNTTTPKISLSAQLIDQSATIQNMLQLDHDNAASLPSLKHDIPTLTHTVDFIQKKFGKIQDLQQQLKSQAESIAYLLTNVNQNLDYLLQEQPSSSVEKTFDLHYNQKLTGDVAQDIELLQLRRSQLQVRYDAFITALDKISAISQLLSSLSDATVARIRSPGVVSSSNPIPVVAVKKSRTKKQPPVAPEPDTPAIGLATPEPVVLSTKKPRKSRKTASTESSPTTTDTLNPPVPASIPTLPKKRGRPRKNPLPDEPPVSDVLDVPSQPVHDPSESSTVAIPSSSKEQRPPTKRATRKTASSQATRSFSSFLPSHRLETQPWPTRRFFSAVPPNSSSVEDRPPSTKTQHGQSFSMPTNSPGKNPNSPQPTPSNDFSTRKHQQTVSTLLARQVDFDHYRSQIMAQLRTNYQNRLRQIDDDVHSIVTVQPSLSALPEAQAQISLLKLQRLRDSLLRACEEQAEAIDHFELFLSLPRWKDPSAIIGDIIPEHLSKRISFMKLQDLTKNMFINPPLAPDDQNSFEYNSTTDEINPPPQNKLVNIRHLFNQGVVDPIKLDQTELVLMQHFLADLIERIEFISTQQLAISANAAIVIARRSLASFSKPDDSGNASDSKQNNTESDEIRQKLSEEQLLLLYRRLAQLLLPTEEYNSLRSSQNAPILKAKTALEKQIESIYGNAMPSLEQKNAKRHNTTDLKAKLMTNTDKIKNTVLEMLTNTNNITREDLIRGASFNSTQDSVVSERHGHVRELLLFGQMQLESFYSLYPHLMQRGEREEISAQSLAAAAEHLKNNPSNIDPLAVSARLLRSLQAETSKNPNKDKFVQDENPQHQKSVTPFDKEIYNQMHTRRMINLARPLLEHVPLPSIDFNSKYFVTPSPQQMKLIPQPDNIPAKDAAMLEKLDSSKNPVRLSVPRYKTPSFNNFIPKLDTSATNILKIPQLTEEVINNKFNRLHDRVRSARLATLLQYGGIESYVRRYRDTQDQIDRVALQHDQMAAASTIHSYQTAAQSAQQEQQTAPSPTEQPPQSIPDNNVSSPSAPTPKPVPVQSHTINKNHQLGNFYQTKSTLRQPSGFAPQTSSYTNDMLTAFQNAELDQNMDVYAPETEPTQEYSPDHSTNQSPSFSSSSTSSIHAHNPHNLSQKSFSTSTRRHNSSMLLPRSIATHNISSRSFAARKSSKTAESAVSSESEGKLAENASSIPSIKVPRARRVQTPVSPQNGSFFDIYPIIRNNLCLSTKSSSLKEIEKLILNPRSQRSKFLAAQTFQPRGKTSNPSHGTDDEDLAINASTRTGDVTHAHDSLLAYYSWRYRFNTLHEFEKAMATSAAADSSSVDKTDTNTPDLSIFDPQVQLTQFAQSEHARSINNTSNSSLDLPPYAQDVPQYHTSTSYFPQKASPLPPPTDSLQTAQEGNAQQPTPNCHDELVALRDYNKQDCVNLMFVTDWLHDINRQNRVLNATKQHRMSLQLNEFSKVYESQEALFRLSSNLYRGPQQQCIELIQEMSSNIEHLHAIYDISQDGTSEQISHQLHELNILLKDISEHSVLNQSLNGDHVSDDSSQQSFDDGDVKL